MEKKGGTNQHLRVSRNYVSNVVTSLFGNRHMGEVSSPPPHAILSRRRIHGETQQLVT